MANEICWVEFNSPDPAKAGSPDPAKAGDFYAKLFGWTSKPSFDGYHEFAAGSLGGGFNGTRPEMPQTLVYIKVSDIDAKLQEIEAAGGQGVFPKTVISPEAGCFAFFRDPNGVIVGLWSET